MFAIKGFVCDVGSTVLRLDVSNLLKLGQVQDYMESAVYNALHQKVDESSPCSFQQHGFALGGKITSKAPRL